MATRRRIALLTPLLLPVVGAADATRYGSRLISEGDSTETLEHGTPR
jgi:hypothetical protein